MFCGTRWLLVRDAGALAGDDDDGHRIQTAGLVLPALVEELLAAPEGPLVPGAAQQAGPTSLGNSGWRKEKQRLANDFTCRFRSRRQNRKNNSLGMTV